MSELFGVDRTVITKHLNNIFDDEELDKNSVCANFAHTATDKAAISKANEEFDVYNKNQKIFSDFDKEIKKLK